MCRRNTPSSQFDWPYHLLSPRLIAVEAILMDLVRRFAIYRLMAIYLYANRHKTRPSRRATPFADHPPWSGP